ncbi:MAG: hypothetical protein M5U26_04145 [Planctomycetota bacterium]|nr:hypothetical protein [Planctomycetota bacterium]
MTPAGPYPPAYAAAPSLPPQAARRSPWTMLILGLLGGVMLVVLAFFALVIYYMANPDPNQGQSGVQNGPQPMPAPQPGPYQGQQQVVPAPAPAPFTPPAPVEDDDPQIVTLTPPQPAEPRNPRILSLTEPQPAAERLPKITDDDPTVFEGLYAEHEKAARRWFGTLLAGQANQAYKMTDEGFRATVTPEAFNVYANAFRNGARPESFEERDAQAFMDSAIGATVRMRFDVDYPDGSAWIFTFFFRQNVNPPRVYRFEYIQDLGQ